MNQLALPLELSRFSETYGDFRSHRGLAVRRGPSDRVKSIHQRHFASLLSAANIYPRIHVALSLPRFIAPFLISLPMGWLSSSTDCLIQMPIGSATPVGGEGERGRYLESRRGPRYNYVERIERLVPGSFRQVEGSKRTIPVRAGRCWLRPVQRCVTVLTGERVRVPHSTKAFPLNLRETTLRIGVLRTKDKGGSPCSRPPSALPFGREN